MTDKEKIIAEIERLKEVFVPTVNVEYQDFSKFLLDFVIDSINSLLAEQPSEELVDAARNIRDTLYLEEGKRDVYGNPYFLQDTILKAVIAGAQWQKEQTINKASQWLNKNVVEYHPRKGELRPIVNINAFRDAMEKEGEQC